MDSNQLMARSLLDVHIKGIKIITKEFRNQYTNYIISLTAPNGESWSVERRYREFDFLHKSIQRTHTTNSHLPHLPNKRNFGLFDHTFIEQRRKDLQTYLMELLSYSPSISLHTNVCEFLNMPENVKLYLSEILAPLEKNELSVDTHKVHTQENEITPNRESNINLPKMCKNEENKDSDPTEIIKNYLQKLHLYPQNKVAILRQFDKWLFGSKIVFNEQMAAFILVGTHNNGLIFEVGSSEDNLMSSISALKIICKLTSIEYCVYASLFVRTLCLTDPAVYLNVMRLHILLKMNFGSVRRDVLQLLYVLSQSMDEHTLLEVIGNDMQAFEQFKSWNEFKKKTENSRFLLINADLPNSISRQENNTSAVLTHKEYEKIALRAYNTLQASFWLETNDTLNEPNIKHFTNRDTQRDKGKIWDLPSPKFSSLSNEIPIPTHTWKRIKIPETFTHLNPSIGYQIIKSSEKLDESLFLIRGSITLPFNAQIVAATLFDYKLLINQVIDDPSIEEYKSNLLMLKQQHWNTKIRFLSITEEINKLNQIIDCSLEASHGPHILARLCLLKSFKYEPNKDAFILSFVSVNHPNSQKKFNRSSPYIGNSLFIPTQEKIIEMRSSGLSIKKIDDENCLLDFSAMFPATSVFVISSELLGESFHFWNSLKNLLTLLQILSTPLKFVEIPIINDVIANSMEVHTDTILPTNSPRISVQNSPKGSSLLSQLASPKLLAKSFSKALDEEELSSLTLEEYTLDTS